MNTAGIFCFLIWRDDPRDVLGGGLGFGRDALRRDEVDAIGGLEIAEGVVGGDDAAAVGRDFRDRVLHLGVERVELAEIGGGVGLIGGLAGRIGRDQRVADIGDIDFRIGDRLPGMRIGVAMAVAVRLPSCAA